MNAQQDTMGGMFGPSPEEVNQSLDSQYMQNVKGADITDLIGQMGTRGARQIAGAMGYEDERVAKARLVQEAVKEARENSEPGDIKGMYKNLADSFAKRGLAQQAMQAQMQYRKLEMEDKTFGLKERETKATERQVDIAAQRAGYEGDANRRANELQAYKIQLEAMTVQERAQEIQKKAIELEQIRAKKAAIDAMPGYEGRMAKAELEKAEAAVSAQLDQAKAALISARASATSAAASMKNADTNARIADSTIKMHEAQAAKYKEETTRLERDQYSHSMKTEADGTVVILATETKPKAGMKPKRQLIKIDPNGVRTVTDLDEAAPQTAAPSVSPTLDAAKAELARRQAAKEGK